MCKVEDQEKEVLLIEKKEEGSKLTLLLQGRLNTSTAPLLEEEFTGDKLEKTSELGRTGVSFQCRTPCSSVCEKDHGREADDASECLG